MKEYISKNKLYNILLWNPSIKKAFVLPPTFGSFEDQRFVVDCAFGFDQVINDYKVVVSFYKRSDINIPKIVEIFTLSTCTWKNVKKFDGPYYWVQGGPKIFLNGKIYWLGIDIQKATPNGIISHFVSFNVRNETLKYVKLPNCELPNALGHERDVERFPINLAQSISLMEVFNTHSQIWVMEGVENMEQSWTKRHTINLQLLHKCLYFKIDGELFFAGNKGGVNSYNIYNEETKVLVKSYKLSPVFTSVYMESLALHNGVRQGTLISFPFR
ncbi:putative F-box protein At1g32420 [Chenopodium quinoa]|uniref:putative F-box protein At1g32420 n=1 Tax=Chenopodium quinoa TaxID=63459 RepID=UPI000B7834F8|nr:putative F-box protein At1g32420 [Chenopodium quinoa]